MAFKPVLAHASCVFDVAGYVKSVKYIFQHFYNHHTMTALHSECATVNKNVHVCDSVVHNYVNTRWNICSYA